MTHLGTRRLETARLILRPFQESDAETMYRNWANDPEVTRFLTWKTHDSPVATRLLLQLWVERSRHLDEYQWAIELKEIQEVIGSISVGWHEDEIPSANIGYCIGTRWWGQGLTAEALRAVVRYLIEDVGMVRVEAKHDTRNPNSGRVMQKAGMTREGVLRSSGRNNQGLADMVVYSILADELPERNYQT